MDTRGHPGNVSKDQKLLQQSYHCTVSTPSACEFAMGLSARRGLHLHT